MSLKIYDRTARVQYTATASQTGFVVPFEFFTSSDLLVYVDQTLQTSGYTVSGAGVEGGGSVNFTTGRTAGEVVTIVRDIPIERTSEFPPTGPFDIDALNTQLARITAQVQQLETILAERVFMLSAWDEAIGASIPEKASRLGKIFSFDATTGDPSIIGVDDFTLPATGPEGPEAWDAPAAWATATVYTATAPRSVVVQSGETYVCLTDHTSGTFATDLAAAKWIKVAAKGADGSGAPAWGGIGGTLGDQTDLAAALAARAAAGSNSDLTKLTGLSGGSTTDVAIRFGANNAGLYYPSAGTIGIATGGTLRLLVNADGTFTSENTATAFGFKGIPSQVKTGAYVLAASDLGSSIDITTGGVTIPDSLPDGFACQVFNNSGSSQTVAKSGSEVMRKVAGSTTASVTLASYGKAFIEKRGSVILIDGNVS